MEDNLPLVLGLCAGIALVGAGVTVWTLDDGDGAGKQRGPVLDLGEADNAMIAAGGRPMLDPLSVGVGIEGEGGKMEEQEDEEEEGRGLTGDTARLMRQRQLLANMAAMSSSASSSSTSLV